MTASAMSMEKVVLSFIRVKCCYVALEEKLEKMDGDVVSFKSFKLGQS